MACLRQNQGLEGKRRPSAVSEGLTCVTYKERKGTQGNNKQRGQRGNVDTTGNVDYGGNLDPATSKVPAPGSRIQGGTYVRNATMELISLYHVQYP